MQQPWRCLCSPFDRRRQLVVELRHFGVAFVPFQAGIGHPPTPKLDVHDRAILLQSVPAGSRVSKLVRRRVGLWEAYLSKCSFPVVEEFWVGDPEKRLVWFGHQHWAQILQLCVSKRIDSSFTPVLLQSAVSEALRLRAQGVPH